jgi:hypothetical protein
VQSARRPIAVLPFRQLAARPVVAYRKLRRPELVTHVSEGHVDVDRERESCRGAGMAQHRVVVSEVLGVGEGVRKREG